MRVDRLLHQRRFLAAYGASGSVTTAARWAKVARNDHYEWMKNDPTYPERFHNAEEQSARAFEDEAARRGREGLRKPVRYKGRIVGFETEYSDTLLLAMLKATNPAKFGDKSKVDISGRVDFDALRKFVRTEPDCE